MLPGELSSYIEELQAEIEGLKRNFASEKRRLSEELEELNERINSMQSNGMLERPAHLEKKSFFVEEETKVHERSPFAENYYYEMDEREENDDSCECVA